MASAPEKQLNGLALELSLLGSRLLSPKPLSTVETSALAGDFLAWSEKAVAWVGAWGRETLVLARKIVTGLSAGRPAEKARERLSAALSEASEKLEMESILPKGGELISESPSMALGQVEDGFFNIPSDDLAGFKDFVGEAPEHVQVIESGLLALSQTGVTDILPVYRGFHTLKGISAFMGLSQLSALAHQAEAILEPFKSGEGRPTEDQVDWLLQACDLIREQVQAVVQGLPSGRFRIVFQDQAPKAQALSVATAGVKGAENADQGTASASADLSMRVQVEKIDALLEIVGELAICQAQVSAGVEAVGVSSHLSSESARLGKICRQLQQLVLSIRMVPVQPLFLRMSRLARDLSRKTGKPLRLSLQGGETEIDRRLVESLAEPLVHLIRNAVDHGVEKAEERLKAGKPEEAVLTLSARHQSGDFILELSDDGRGLNYEKLAFKARQAGWLVEGETPTREKLTEFIFRPGFSTAETVTEVSGRGVGLDAVRRKIQSLKGSLTVESEPGQGTKFRLRIPRTLLLMEGILVRMGSERYVLPASQVLGFLALDGTQTHAVGEGRQWLDTDQGQLLLIDLEEDFGSRVDGKTRSLAVQVEVDGRRACLVVDEVLGKQQVVLKELGESLHDLKGVLGGAILGEGRVGLILDMEWLVRMMSEGSSRN